MTIEAPDTIEPARIDAPDGELPDLIAEVAAKGEALGQKLHPRTAENLAGFVRIMNTYYSNLIHATSNAPWHGSIRKTRSAISSSRRSPTFIFRLRSIRWPPKGVCPTRPLPISYGSFTMISTRVRRRRC